jgi:perosamine synthetase
MTIENDFVTTLRTVLGEPSQPLPLHAPSFEGREWEFVKDCLDSTFVSSVGKYVDEFENRLAAFTGARHAIAVVNGTAALQVALHLLGVRHGDEVLIPSLSFVATANAVAHSGGIPHFVDSDASSMGIDPGKLDKYLAESTERLGGALRNRRTGRKIAALVPMHTYGHAVPMEPLMVVAQRHGLPVLEDAAEALGSYYKGQHLGTFGQLGTLSFNGNKIVTTGGGGAILTNDPSLAKMAKHLTTTAKRSHAWEFFHDQVAWNYRMPNLNAALGCAQLEKLPDFLARKRALACKYASAFIDSKYFAFMHEPADCTSNYWLNTVRMLTPSLPIRNSILRHANEAGFMCRPTWTLLHHLPMYADCPRSDLQVAEELEASLINLPSSPDLEATGN